MNKIKWLHINKPYTWNPLLLKYVPNPGEPYRSPKRGLEKEQRERFKSGKAFRRFEKLKRRILKKVVKEEQERQALRDQINEI